MTDKSNLGKCESCSFWRRGTVSIYSSDAKQWGGSDWVPHALRGQTFWEPAENDCEVSNIKPIIGWCGLLGKEQDSNSDLAQANGYDVNRNFWCSSLFGCILWGPFKDPSEQIYEFHL